MCSICWRPLAAMAVLVSLSVQEAAAQVTPQRVKAALPKLEKLAQQALQDTGVPGMAIVVVYKDQAVYVKGFGVRQAGKAEPVDAATVFQLASLSKPIASTIMAILVSLGLMDWDDHIIDHDADFRMYDPWVTQQVTFRDLLCHRSGLPDHGGDLLEDLGYDRDQVLHRLRYLKPASSFRSEYAYTNFGYTAAAVAAARAAGKSWEELAVEKLYRPLGMKSTSSRFADYAANKNRAHLHVRINGKWVAKYVRNPDAQSPAGGVSSSAEDLAQWMRLQLSGGKFNGKQMIDANALGETHRPQVISMPPANPATNRAGFYGLGWVVSYDDHGRVRLGHSGAFDLGAATAITLLPSEDLGIAVLTNAAPIGVPETICASFIDLVLSGTIQKDWAKAYKKAFEELNAPAYGTEVNYRKPPERQSPPLPPEAYIGKYENDFFGPIEITAADGKLTMRMGPKKTAFALQHWDRDIFYYQPAGEMAGGLSGVAFSIGPDRHAVNVVIEDLNVHNQGTFVRIADR